MAQCGEGRGEILIEAGRRNQINMSKRPERTNLDLLGLSE